MTDSERAELEDLRAWRKRAEEILVQRAADADEYLAVMAIARDVLRQWTNVECKCCGIVECLHLRTAEVFYDLRRLTT